MATPERHQIDSRELETLRLEWLEHARIAKVNSENRNIHELDRRQCVGVAQAYEQCAAQLEAAKSGARPVNTGRIRHVHTDCPFCLCEPKR